MELIVNGLTLVPMVAPVTLGAVLAIHNVLCFTQIVA